MAAHSDESEAHMHAHVFPHWEKLGPQERRRVIERREELVNLLQTGYGKSREDAVREVNEFFAEYFAGRPTDQ